MENLSKDREIVQRVAQEALDGQTGVIDAARILLPLLRRLPGLPSEEDFNLRRSVGILVHRASSCSESGEVWAEGVGLIKGQ